MTDTIPKKEAFKHGHYDNIGHYQHDTEICLNSKHALRLVGGRQADLKAKEKWARHEVIGLVKFAPAAIRLYKMAYGDNPYVDEALIQLETRIVEAEEYFESKIKYLEKILKAVPSNTVIHPVKSTKPFHLKPNFGGNPYANKGTLLLAYFDQVMTLMETCRANALIKRREANDIEYHSGRYVRRVFVCPGEFEPCSVTREDIRKKTDIAEKVIAARGKPNDAVLNKEVMPEFGPVIDDFEYSEMEDILAAISRLEQ